MTKRSYKQNCSLAHAADLIGERWTFLILRELLLKPCRFGDLLEPLEGMGTNLLSTRLRELEAERLIEKVAPEQKRSAYQLSAKGRELEEVIFAMIRWGLRHGEAVEGFTHIAHWDLLAMKALFEPRNLQKSCTVQFESSTLTAWITISEKGCEHGFGLAKEPDILFDCNIVQLQQRLQNGLYTSENDVLAFVGCFPLPNT